jgi:5'-phosphate synthase pdxT subunit
MEVGVLALQGAFIEHITVLQRIGIETREVRLPKDIQGLDGLVIPGGESTTIGKLAVTYGLVNPIRAMAQDGRPIWGTCAGMIFLARAAIDGAAGQSMLGLIDIIVVRNGFGRQVNSFEADLDVPILGKPPFRGIFIRAPYIQQWGDEVEILTRLETGEAVAAQQGNILTTAFHPELTDDGRFHRHFLQLVEGSLAPVETPAPVVKEDTAA